jgi:hypothetical protein
MGRPKALPSVFDRTFDFPAGFPGLDGFPTIVEFLPLGQAELDLGMTAWGKIDAQGNQGQALLLGLAEQFIDLLLVQQQLTHTNRIMVHDVAVTIGTDVAMVQKHLSALHGCVAILQIGPSVAQRFHFGPLQDDPGFEFFLDEILVIRFAVRNDDFLALFFGHA